MEQSKYCRSYLARMIFSSHRLLKKGEHKLAEHILKKTGIAEGERVLSCLGNYRPPANGIVKDNAKPVIRRMESGLRAHGDVSLEETDEFRTHCCHEIGIEHKKERTVECPSCCKKWDRDKNAAINIRRLGVKKWLKGEECPEPFRRIT